MNNSKDKVTIKFSSANALNYLFLNLPCHRKIIIKIS